MKNKELDTLIMDLLDGSLQARDLPVLEQELSSSPEAMQRYLDYSNLDILLTIDTEIGDATPPSVVPIDRIIRRQKQRSIRISVIAAAAIILTSLVVMQLFFIDRSSPPTIAFKTSPCSVFSISHTSSVGQISEKIMEPGSQLKINQGTVELTFESGVKSIVVAPADMTLHESNKLYLREGSAWFQVPKGAEGFEVFTDDFNIIDLGTEFAVTAIPDDHDEVHVFKGKVQVTARRLRKESTVLSADNACKIDPIGRLSTIPINPSDFLTSLPDTLPNLHWSFDQKDGYQVKGIHPAAADTHTQAIDAPALTPGKKGDALSLDGTSQHLITDWPGFEGSRPRTVSFWIKIPDGADYTKSPGIVGWGDRTLENGKWKIAISKRLLNTPAKIRLSWGRQWVTSDLAITPDVWQHILVTSPGTLNEKGLPHAEIYIDGQITKTFPGAIGPRSLDMPKTTTITSQSVPLLIGSDLYSNQQQRKFFTGEIDELTIYDGYMTKRDVQKLISQ